MRANLRPSVVVTALVAAIILPLGPALASTAAGTETSPSGSAAIDPLPTEPAEPTEPTGPTQPAPTSPSPADPSTSLPAMPEQAPTVLPRSSTAPSAVPAPPPAPVAGSDGVVPMGDYVDEYFALTSRRDTAEAAVDAARNRLSVADAAVSSLAALAVRASLDAALTRGTQREAGDDVDDMVRELYQRGETGLTSVASILVGGPDAFLDGLESMQQAQSVANGSVRGLEGASVAASWAEVAHRTAVARVQAAVLERREADGALLAAEALLRGLDAKILELGKVAPQVAVGPEGCPKQDVPATLRDGSDALGAARLCRWAVRNAATPQAALALGWAFRHLGAEYACGGAGRMLPFRADCSSFVSRAYAEGAGLRTAGDGWAPSTRDMVPWDGVALDPHYAEVRPQDLRPGDLVLYDTCPQGGCPYKHVVMYLGSPDGKTAWMLHTNACGDVAKVEAFWGFDGGGSRTFLVARRVVALPGEKVTTAAGAVAGAVKVKPAPRPVATGSIGR